MSETGCGTVDVGGLINVWEGMGGGVQVQRLDCMGRM